MDWRITSAVALVTLALFGLVLKKFFLDAEDWRIMIPIFVIASLLLGAYYITTMKDVKYTSTSMLNIAAIAILMVVSNLAIFLSVQNGPLSVVIPIINLNSILIVVFSIMFLGESFTLLKGAGVLLGVISVYLVMNG